MLLSRSFSFDGPLTRAPTQVTLAGVEAEAAGNRGVTNGRGLNIGVDVETEVQVQREPVVIRFEDGLEAQKDTVDKW